MVVAGYPKIFETVPRSPIYRAGILATRWVVNGAHVAVLDLAPWPGFSGGPVIDVSAAEPSVFAVVKGYAADKDADFTAAYVIPIETVRASLNEYNAQKRESLRATEADSTRK